MASSVAQFAKTWKDCKYRDLIFKRFFRLFKEYELFERWASFARDKIQKAFLTLDQIELDC